VKISCYYRHPSTSRDGFGLIVIAALFTAAALIGTAMIETKTATNELINQQSQRDELSRISRALNQYALRYGRLPCPAQTSIPSTGMDMYYGTEVNNGQCTKNDFAPSPGMIDAYAGIDKLKKNGAESEMIRGMVPFKVLIPFGLTEDDAYDAYNNRIMYVVNRNLTNHTSSANIAVDRAVLTDAANGSASMEMDFLVINYGRDKMGGLSRGAQAINCADAIEPSLKSTTCQILPSTPCPSDTPSGQNCNDDVSFIKKPRNLSSDGAQYFDDDLIGGRVTCYNGTLNRASDGGCGNTYCWGDNASGQLGTGTTSPTNAPIAVTMPNGVTAFQSISVSAVTGANAVACAISASFDNNGMALPYGDIYCWGNWDNTTARTVPTKISGGGLPMGFKATTVQVENSSICAAGGTITTNGFNASGAIYCWGKNNEGQLGDESTDDSSVPVTVKNPYSINFNASPGYNIVSGNGTNWCAVGHDTKVYCWGNGHNPPQQLVDAGSNVFSIGGRGSMAYKTDTSGLIGWNSALTTVTTIYTPGDVNTPNSQKNTYEIKQKVNTLNADGTVTTSYSPIPVGTPLNANEPSRDGNDSHQCISLKNNNDTNILYCKGDNSKGQLGNGNTTNSLNFIEVIPPTNVAFTSISIGGKTSCALAGNGQAYCWGDNSAGQLGIGSNTHISIPTPVAMPSSLKGFTKLVTGGNTSCALAPIK